MQLILASLPTTCSGWRTRVSTNLVDGQLVEKQRSSLASKTAGIITQQLVGFFKPTEGGHVFPEQSFCCFPQNPDLVRRPDIAEYRSAGVKLIWIINPKMRVMRIYRPEGNVPELVLNSDMVTGDPVLHGFSMSLRDLLPPVQPASAATP